MGKTVSCVIVYVLCVVALAYSLYSTWGVILSDLPIEFREGHSMSSTLLMLDGKTPFDVTSYPQYYNSYGIVYNVLMVPFVWLFGKSIVVFRVVNELFWIFTVLFVTFYKSYSFNTRKAVVLVATYILFHYNTNLSVRPDGLGTFLFVASLVIPYRNNFSNRSVLIALLLSVVAFYTKPYFVISWVIMSVAYIFVDWRKCIIFNVLFAFVFIFSAWMIVRLFPLYFYETIFAYSSDMGESMGVDISGLHYSWLQFKWTLKDSTPFIILCIPLFMNLKEIKIHTLILYIIVVTAVLIYPLGTNFGSTQTYHSQMLIPMLALLSIELTSMVKYDYLCTVVASILLFFTLYRMPFYGHYESSEWNRILNYTNSSDKVLNSPIVAPVLFLEDKEVTDDGVSGFALSFVQRPITTFLFGQDTILLRKKHKYSEMINERINNMYYDCIILTSGTSVISYVDSTFYHKVDSFKIDLPLNPSFYVNIYKPNNSQINLINNESGL